MRVQIPPPVLTFQNTIEENETFISYNFMSIDNEMVTMPLELTDDEFQLIGEAAQLKNLTVKEFIQKVLEDLTNQINNEK